MILKFIDIVALEHERIRTPPAMAEGEVSNRLYDIMRFYQA